MIGSIHILLFRSKQKLKTEKRQAGFLKAIRRHGSAGWALAGPISRNLLDKRSKSKASAPKIVRCMDTCKRSHLPTVLLWNSQMQPMSADKKENQVMNRFVSIVMVALVLPVLAGAQKPSAVAHPDLSGLWLFSIDLPPTALNREINGKVQINRIDASGRRPGKSDFAGALSST